MQLRKFPIVSISFRWQQKCSIEHCVRACVCVRIYVGWDIEIRAHFMCTRDAYAKCLFLLWTYRQREMVQVFVRSEIKANHQRNDSITTAAATVAIEMALNEYSIIQYSHVQYNRNRKNWKSVFKISFAYVVSALFSIFSSLYFVDDTRRVCLCVHGGGRTVCETLCAFAIAYVYANHVCTIFLLHRLRERKHRIEIKTNSDSTTSVATVTH